MAETPAASSKREQCATLGVRKNDLVKQKRATLGVRENDRQQYSNTSYHYIIYHISRIQDGKMASARRHKSVMCLMLQSFDHMLAS